MLTYRFYRSAVVGDGTLGNPFRSKLTDYITQDGSGMNFWDWIHDARAVRYALAYCESSIHVAINDDAEIEAFSPEFDDALALNAWLDGTLAGVPQSVRNRFEADGFSVGWASAQTTRREMLRYISRSHVQTQELRRLKNVVTRQLFQEGLDATVGSLPLNVRNGTRDWMITKGLDTSWIVAGTTIRQVLHYLQANVEWPVLALGPVEL